MCDEAEVQQVLRFNLVRFFVAFMAKDYVAAAELARHSTLRIMEPLCLVGAGKLDEAARTLQTLRGDSTLSEPERTGFESIEPLILMATHRFDEARAALRVLRGKPAGDPESTRYLDALERILVDWEAGGKTRPNPKP